VKTHDSSYILRGGSQTVWTNGVLISFPNTGGVYLQCLEMKYTTIFSDLKSFTLSSVTSYLHLIRKFLRQSLNYLVIDTDLSLKSNCTHHFELSSPGALDDNGSSGRNGSGTLPSCSLSESCRLYVRIAIKVNEFAILKSCHRMLQK
jgi:hypothetical protein